MPETRIVLGEPDFLGGCGLDYYTPLGQKEVVKKHWDPHFDSARLASALKEEYLAVFDALERSATEFAVINIHKTHLKKGDSLLKIGHPTVKMGAYVKMKYRRWPRDFCLNLAGRVALLNPRATWMRAAWKERLPDAGWIYSLLGEGGGSLQSGNVLIHPEQVAGIRDGNHQAKKFTETLHELGVQTVEIPNPCGCYVWPNRSYDDHADYHLDREMCLITGKTGNLHLVVDPRIVVYDRHNKLVHPPKSLEAIRKACDPAGIEVHAPKKMHVPYSLGAWQAPNGKIVMTSGDEVVADLLRGIIGEKSVIQTAVPIVAYPVYQYAGVRCLIGEFPDFLC